MPKAQSHMRMEVTSVDDFGNDLATAIAKVLQAHGPDIVYRTCESCLHMAEDGPAHCKKYNMTPPVYVITHGCDAHDDKEDIPF